MKTQLLVVLCSLGMGVWATCSSDGNQLIQNQPELTEDEFVSQVEFNDLLTVVATRANPTMPPNKKTKGIISARLARKSRGCNSGFGLCDFKLFPKSSAVSALKQTIALDEKLFEVVLDEESHTYEANLLLAKPLPEGVSADLSSLKIDEDIYWVKDEVTMAKVNEVVIASPNSEIIAAECQSELFETSVYKVEAKPIKYDPDLGENGGYKIQLLDKIE